MSFLLNNFIMSGVSPLIPVGLFKSTYKCILCSKFVGLYLNYHVLADEDGLRIYQIKNRVRQILIWSDLFRQMSGLDCLVHINIHRQFVILYPLLWHALQLASDWVFSYFDARHRHQWFALFKLHLFISCQHVRIKCLLILSPHIIIIIDMMICHQSIRKLKPSTYIS